MKAISIPLRLSSFGLTLFLFLLLSCKTQVDPASSTIPSSNLALVSVNEAKSYYEANYLSKTNSSAKAKNKPIRVPIWSLAVEHRKSKDDADNMLSIPIIQDKRNLDRYGDRKLLVFKDKNNKNKLTYGLLEIFADKDYAESKNYVFDSKDFSGTLLFHDLDKGFESGFILKNGKPVGIVKDLKEYDEDGNVVNSVNKKSAGARECTQIQWEKCYGTKYYDDNGAVIYSPTTCFADHVETIGFCDTYYPIWKNYIDFTYTSGGSYQQSDVLNKVSLLNGKLTVALNARPCLHAIIEKLITQCNPLSKLGQILQASGLPYDFYRFVADLTSSATTYRIYVQEATMGDNSNTVYHTSDPNNIVINVNSQYLNNATNLSVARTVVHELLHAYLFVGIKNPTVYGQSFVEVNNYLMNVQGLNITSSQHHLMMAAEYRSCISSMLNNFINVTGTYLPSPLGPTEAYTEKLSWGGLKQSAPYNVLSDAEKQAIQSALVSEENHINLTSDKKDC